MEDVFSFGIICMVLLLVVLMFFFCRMELGCCLFGVFLVIKEICGEWFKLF